MDSFCDFLKQIGILGQAGSYCYLQTDVDRLVEAEHLEDKEAVKKVSKFYKKDFVKRLLDDVEYYKQILADSEEYVNKNANLVAKAMLDDEIDIVAATEEVKRDEIEEQEYLNGDDE